MQSRIGEPEPARDVRPHVFQKYIDLSSPYQAVQDLLPFIGFQIQGETLLAEIVVQESPRADGSRWIARPRLLDLDHLRAKIAKERPHRRSGNERGYFDNRSPG